MIAHHCDGLEAVVQGNATERRVHQIHDIRWADDFIVTANSREVLEQTVLPRINSLCHQTKGASPNKLIDTLNPILRGWVNYHRHVNSAETFSRLDNHL